MPKKTAHVFEEKWRSDDVKLLEEADFSSLLLSERVLSGLKKAGFKNPSPIQLEAIPIGRFGKDLVVQAKSGTGKTLVFSVVALEMLMDLWHPQVLILAPTREIAFQICDVIHAVGSSFKKLKCCTFIGGFPLDEDIKKARGCQIAVGTPGRVKQLITMKMLRTHSIRLFVLDEADQLLDPSFKPEIDLIFGSLPKEKQVIATSATYPKKLRKLVDRYFREPFLARLNINELALLGIVHYTYIVQASQMPVLAYKLKIAALENVLTSVKFSQCLVFCNLVSRVESLCSDIKQWGFSATFISSAKEQAARLKAIDCLKRFKCKVLVSSDVTSRGIDAENVDLIINFDMPTYTEVYLHRVGRAGRYGSKGVAITFLSKNDIPAFHTIEKDGNFKGYILPDPVPSNLINMRPDQIASEDNGSSSDSDELVGIPELEKSNPNDEIQSEQHNLNGIENEISLSESEDLHKSNGINTEKSEKDSNESDIVEENQVDIDSQAAELGSQTGSKKCISSNEFNDEFESENSLDREKQLSSSKKISIEEGVLQDLKSGILDYNLVPLSTTGKEKYIDLPASQTILEVEQYEHQEVVQSQSLKDANIDEEGLETNVNIKLGNNGGFSELHSDKGVILVNLEKNDILEEIEPQEYSTHIKTINQNVHLTTKEDVILADQNCTVTLSNDSKMNSESIKLLNINVDLNKMASSNCDMNLVALPRQSSMGEIICFDQKKIQKDADQDIVSQASLYACKSSDDTELLNKNKSELWTATLDPEQKSQECPKQKAAGLVDPEGQTKTECSESPKHTDDLTLSVFSFINDYKKKQIGKGSLDNEIIDSFPLDSAEMPVDSNLRKEFIINSLPSLRNDANDFYHKVYNNYKNDYITLHGINQLTDIKGTRAPEETVIENVSDVVNENCDEAEKIKVVDLSSWSKEIAKMNNIEDEGNLTTDSDSPSEYTLESTPNDKESRGKNGITLNPSSDRVVLPNSSSKSGHSSNSDTNSSSSSACSNKLTQLEKSFKKNIGTASKRQTYSKPAEKLKESLREIQRFKSRKSKIQPSIQKSHKNVRLTKTLPSSDESLNIPDGEQHIKHEFPIYSSETLSDVDRSSTQSFKQSNSKQKISIFPKTKTSGKSDPTYRRQHCQNIGERVGTAKKNYNQVSFVGANSSHHDFNQPHTSSYVYNSYSHGESDFTGANSGFVKNSCSHQQRHYVNDHSSSYIPNSCSHDQNHFTGGDSSGQINSCLQPSQHRCHFENGDSSCQSQFCVQWYEIFYRQWNVIQQASNFQ